MKPIPGGPPAIAPAGAVLPFSETTPAVTFAADSVSPAESRAWVSFTAVGVASFPVALTNVMFSVGVIAGAPIVAGTGYVPSVDVGIDPPETPEAWCGPPELRVG